MKGQACSELCDADKALFAGAVSYLGEMSENDPEVQATQEPEVEQRKPHAWDYVRANYKLFLIGIGLFIIGAIIGRVFPPFVFDKPFWYDFFSGPPVAGIFAVIAAGIAYSAASLGNKTTRLHAEEEEWWTRAEWGIGLAMSDDEGQKIIGLTAVYSLVDDASRREDALIESVAKQIIEQNTVDTWAETSETVMEEGDGNGTTHSS